jgi:hypothetical protein
MLDSILEMLVSPMMSVIKNYVHARVQDHLKD